MIPGLINLDFADVRTIMQGMGDALMGTGVAKGENRAVQSAQMALSSPLLDDVSIRGAKGVLVNITGDERMSLHEVSQATAIISEEAGDDANVIFGAVVSCANIEEMHVTVIATGFTNREREIIPSFAAETTAPDVFGVSGAGDIRGVDEEHRSGEPHEYAVVGAEVNERPVCREAGERPAHREPNIDIPTFLRKQLD
jgi:cell division protein FtsZ